MVCADIKSRLRSTIPIPVRTGCSGVGKRGEKRIREGGGGDKAVFKRVLTPRQGPNGSRWRGVGHRELRLRVSPVILVYMPSSCLDAGPHGSWILPLLHLPRSPCRTPPSSEADATDVCARCTQGPRQAHRETSFSRLRRGQAVRAHAIRTLCRSLSGRTPPFPSPPRLFISHLSRQLRASLFQRDLLSSATRGS